VSRSDVIETDIARSRTRKARADRFAEIGNRLVAGAVVATLMFAALGFDSPDRVASQVPGNCSPLERDLTVIVVAIDGVRWQEVYTGTDPALLGGGQTRTGEQLTPNLHALARRGVALGAPGLGEPFEASGPNFVSLPGYYEMLNGRPATCQENNCTIRPTHTLADAFAERSKEASAGVISSWPEIARVASAAGSPVAASCGKQGGDTREAMRMEPALRAVIDEACEAPNHPGAGDYRPDEHTIDLALAYLDAQPPSFLFVSLGDTDEYGHHGDYQGYLDALARADRFIGSLDRLSDAWAEQGRDTIIVVTTDHGRSNDFKNHGRQYPESARGWLVAAGGPIPRRGYVASPETRYLRDIAPTLAAIAGLSIEMTPTSGQVIPELASECRVDERRTSASR